MLTDGMPDWMPPAPRAALYDASHHRPRYAVIDAADPHVREAERAYYDRNKWLQDAWRRPPMRRRRRPDDDDDDDDLSPRDRYVRNLQTAYRTPIGSNGNGADAIEAQRRRWNAESPTKDAALADRDIAYGEYLDYLTERLEKALRGGRRREALTTEPAEELDARIATAFSDDAKSGDVARLLAEVKEAASAAELAAETARKRALDPLLSGDDLKLARREMDDAAFKRGGA